MRRRAFITLLGCAACAALAISSKYRALAIDPVHRTEIDGRGYKLWFIGGMRDAIMMGRREATLDLRTLKDQSHLYGVGRLTDSLAKSQLQTADLPFPASAPTIQCTSRETLKHGCHSFDR